MIFFPSRSNAENHTYYRVYYGAPMGAAPLLRVKAHGASIIDVAVRSGGVYYDLYFNMMIYTFALSTLQLTKKDFAAWRIKCTRTVSCFS